METQANWVTLPKPNFRTSVRWLFSNIPLFTQGILLDGALISYMKSSLVIPKQQNNQYYLAFEKIADDVRFLAYNPWTKKTSLLLPDIAHWHDIALVSPNGGFWIRNTVELEQEGMVRLVSYGEALRYLWISESEVLIASAQKKSPEMRKNLGEEVYQVTEKWSNQVRVVMQENRFFPKMPFSGGGWSFRRRKLVHA